jgi:hypothetical protein
MGLYGETRQRLTALDATGTIGGAVASGRVFHESPTRVASVLIEKFRS